MPRSIAPFLKQPLAAFVVTIIAMLGVIWSWFGLPASTPLVVSDSTALLALCFIVICVGADIYPIHVTYHTKVSITTLLLYLMAVVLPPPLAALAAGVSRLVAEFLERHKRGSLPSDIVTGTGRWVFVAVVTAWVAHLPTAGEGGKFAVLVAAAIVMFVADVCSLVFELAPIFGDPPTHIILTTIKSAGLIEAVQYNIGILVALAVEHNFWELILLAVPFGLAYRMFKDIKEVRHSTRQLLERLADAVDLRDPYTGGHSRRVTAYCEAILREMKLAGPDVDLIISAARVHDIGKIGIPDVVLNKPDKLTAEEWAIMTTHSARGAELLARYPDFARGVEIVRHHHERWDGKGYPDGLAGPAIPFGARVIAVADSFDAMTSDRPYRKGMPVEKALHILRSDNGQQWDIRVVDAFLHSFTQPDVPEANCAQSRLDDQVRLTTPV